MTIKKEMIHGKTYTYSGLKCRCDECRNAQRLYMANYRLTEAGKIARNKSAARQAWIISCLVAWVKMTNPEIVEHYKNEWQKLNND